MASPDPPIKSPPFFMPHGHFTMYHMYGVKINDHRLVFPQAYGTEVKYCPSLDLSSDNLLEQGTPAIWDKGLENVSFIPIPNKGNAKECSNYHTITLISHANKVMLKILQARLQQYVDCELPDVQAGF